MSGFRMRFDVIVHAPSLRTGVRLNIAEADQVAEAAPGRLEVGSELTLRFGVCCPDVSTGTITGRETRPEAAVLAVDGETWTLLRGPGGVTDSGLVSEDWFVAGPGALSVSALAAL